MAVAPTLILDVHFERILGEISKGDSLKGKTHGFQSTRWIRMRVRDSASLRISWLSPVFGNNSKPKDDK